MQAFDTRDIITAIKKYSNVYSDISALNFQNTVSVTSLLWILHFDTEAKFGVGFNLEDKLLWGSDLPMTMGRFPTYFNLFSLFEKAMKYDPELLEYTQA